MAALEDTSSHWEVVCPLVAVAFPWHCANAFSRDQEKNENKSGNVLTYM